MGGVNTLTTAGEGRGPRARNGGPRPDPRALAEGLDRLREALLHRLGQIEALAGRRNADAGPAEPDRERALREKVASLEAGQARLHAEFRRRQEEWEETRAQLDEDRRLLTEAWERLESERAEAVNSAEAARGGAPPGQAQGHGRPAAPAAAPANFQSASETVTVAILREFEALRGDIRRNAKSKSGR